MKLVDSADFRHPVALEVYERAQTNEKVARFLVCSVQGLDHQAIADSVLRRPRRIGRPEPGPAIGSPASLSRIP